MKEPSKEAKSSGIGTNDISAIAYQMWEDAGRPAGRYMDFWMKATQQVMAEHKSTAQISTAQVDSPQQTVKGHPPL